MLWMIKFVKQSCIMLFTQAAWIAFCTSQQRQLLKEEAKCYLFVCELLLYCTCLRACLKVKDLLLQCDDCIINAHNFWYGLPHILIEAQVVALFVVINAS